MKSQWIVDSLITSSKVAEGLVAKKRYKSNEGFYEGNPRDDVTFHDEILDNPEADRALSKVAIKRAIKGGMSAELAERIYGSGCRGVGGEGTIAMAGIDEVPELIGRLYEVVDDLERLFPGRKFTPDGHLVGSIGEVIAAHLYDLELLPASTKRHDAKAPDGTLVQVKATQRRMIGISSKPVHLLVLKLHRNGKATEFYNGPGENAWDAAGPMQKNGQRPISLSKLEKVMESIPQEHRLAQVREE